MKAMECPFVIAKGNPDVVDEIKKGEKTISQIKREIREKKRRENAKKVS